MDIPHTSKTKLLLKLSFPMMLSWLSNMLMIFTDRLFLAQVSNEALAAAVAAGTMAWTFTCSFEHFTELSEIFTAQHNGAKRFELIGPTCWQMFYCSLFSLIVFIPLGLLGAELYAPLDNGANKAIYFKYFLFAGPLYGILGACVAFFVGQGKTAVITKACLLGNAINIILDPLFIFGYTPYLKPMGVEGAALASCLGIFFQVLYLLFHFFSAYNRRVFATWNYRFDKAQLLSISSVCYPSAMFAALEIGAWAIYYHQMEDLSPLHITITGVCQSIFLTLLFFGVGLQKGISALSGNLIGAKRVKEVPELLSSGFYLILAYAAITAFGLFACKDLLYSLFFSDFATTNLSDFSSAVMSNSDIKGLLAFALGIQVIYLFFENLRASIVGILASAGDTLFIMWGGVFCIWFFLLMPTWFIIHFNIASIQLALCIWILFSFISTLIYYMRYLQGNWKKKVL